MGKETIAVKRKVIHNLENLRVGFNEEDFLLVFNAENEDLSDGYALTIPAEIMAEIVDGLYSSGLEYQAMLGKSIGFKEKEV